MSRDLGNGRPCYISVVCGCEGPPEFLELTATDEERHYFNRTGYLQFSYDADYKYTLCPFPAASR
jgi:hypothetical protein